MNDQPKPATGEHELREKVKDFCENHGFREHFIEQDLFRLVNAALAAEREKVDESMRLMHYKDKQVQPLVDALKEIKGLCGMPSERRGKSGMRLVKILNATVAGLARVKERK